MGNAVVAGLSDKPKAKTPAEEKKLSATEQADLDLKMAEMDAALHNRMEGKAEDGATFTPNGTEEVRTYTTTAKVDSSGNVYEQTNSYHINKKELQNLVYEDQGKALLSVLSLQHDDELSFGRDSILSREKGRFLSAELNDYIDQAHGRKALSDALANVSLTGITGTFRSALRSFTCQAEEKVVPVAQRLLTNTRKQFSGGKPTIDTDAYSPKSVSNRTIENRKLYGFEESGPYPGSFKRPEVGDPKLKNIVNQMYKGDQSPSGIVGTGSTADAARWEFENNTLLKGTDHLNNKAPQLINAIRTWISKNPAASASDIHAAQEMLKDLERARMGMLND